MKTKIFLGLAACCLLVSIGGLVLPKTSQAQRSNSAYLAPIEVYFGEDFMREHGLQVMSYCVDCPPSAATFVATVPSDKRFVITDIMANIQDVTVGLHNNSGSDYCQIRFNADTEHYGFRSGVVVEPNCAIYISQCGTSTFTVTVSGYFVDL